MYASFQTFKVSSFYLHLMELKQYPITNNDVCIKPFYLPSVEQKSFFLKSLEFFLTFNGNKTKIQHHQWKS